MQLIKSKTFTTDGFTYYVDINEIEIYQRILTLSVVKPDDTVENKVVLFTISENFDHFFNAFDSLKEYLSLQNTPSKIDHNKFVNEAEDIEPLVKACYVPDKWKDLFQFYLSESPTNIEKSKYIIGVVVFVKDITKSHGHIKSIEGDIYFYFLRENQFNNRPLIIGDVVIFTPIVSSHQENKIIADAVDYIDNPLNIHLHEEIMKIGHAKGTLLKYGSDYFVQYKYKLHTYYRLEISLWEEDVFNYYDSLIGTVVSFHVITQPDRFKTKFALKKINYSADYTEISRIIRKQFHVKATINKFTDEGAVVFFRIRRVLGFIPYDESTPEEIEALKKLVPNTEIMVIITSMSQTKLRVNMKLVI
jgi:hypothetical protein